MRKWVALVVVAGWPVGLRAQDAAVAPPALSWGARAGLTYANTDFNAGSPPPPTPLSTTWRPGFVAGFWVSIALPHPWLVQQEYAFEQLSGELLGGPRYPLRYLPLLLLGYYVHPRVKLLAGPQFDLLVQAQQQASGQVTDSTHDTEERGLAATAGLEVGLSHHLSLGVRSMRGLNHISIGPRPAVREFKFEAAQLVASVRF